MRNVISLLSWTVGLVYFGIACLAVLLLSFILPQRALHVLMRWMLRFLFVLLRIPVRVEGREKIDRKQIYLFMANHQSLFDVPLVAAVIPVFVRGIEATRQFKWPFYGWVVRRLGNIPIERENVHGAIKAIHKAEEKLKSGVSMVVMPEGHRTRDGRMMPFKKLPFFLAKQAGVPIAPMGLSGLYELKRLGSWMIHPRPVRVRFGDPIPAETVRALSEVELMNLIRERIRAMVEEPAAS